MHVCGYMYILIDQQTKLYHRPMMTFLDSREILSNYISSHILRGVHAGLLGSFVFPESRLPSPGQVDEVVGLAAASFFETKGDSLQSSSRL